MDRRINAALIRKLRQQRAWSQEHLAEVAGLGLRTVQRVESDGKASFESLRALAAVFDMHADSLLIEESTPAISQNPTHRPELAKLLAALSVVILGTWGALTTTWVSAQQIRLDYDLTIDDEDQGTSAKVAQNNLTMESGEESEIVIDELVKIVLSLELIDSTAVLISSRIYSYTESGFTLIGEPKMLVANTNKARLVSGRETQGPDGRMSVKTYSLDLTPTIQQ